MSLMTLCPVPRNAIAAAIFNISSIFASGEQGVQLEPWDPSTMFQDAAGTIPVTGYGQAVGLRVDKSKGLAKTLWKYFDFTSTTGWTLGSWTMSGGKLSASGLANNSIVYYSFAPMYGIGDRLEITYTISGLTSGGVSLGINNGGGNGTVKTANGTYTETLTHVAGSPLIRFLTSGASTTLSIDDLIVNKVEGHHAYQATATKRPIYNNFVDFDGIDDEMNIVFPNLGSDVTIARAVPGVGVSILTGQTIGAGTYTLSADDNGLIIVNRALTPAETAGVTAYLNARV